MYIHTYICTYIHMYIYAYTHIHIYTCTHIHREREKERDTDPGVAGNADRAVEALRLLPLAVS